MKTHLITFADGSTDYIEAGKRLAMQAIGFGGIDEAIHFTKESLDEGYFEIFRDFPARFSKGFGLWSWKPYLVLRSLENMPDGDVLIYMDAGCELNKGGRVRFAEYISMAKQSGATFFELPRKNGAWTKNDPRLLGPQDCAERNQIIATTFILHNSRATRKFAKEWLSLCALDDGTLLKDPLPEERQAEYFKDHRHDQSCLTRCIFDTDFTIIPDETWNRNFKNLRQKPFIAMRNKTGRSRLHRVYPFPASVYLRIHGILRSVLIAKA